MTKLLEVTHIVVHHSGSSYKNTTHDKIKEWHLKRGFDDIGYHFTVDYKGIVKEGRPTNIKGAHNLDGGFNSKSLGVCIMGNFNNEEPTKNAYKAAVYKFAQLCRAYRLSSSQILGHKETGADTDCPGHNFDLHKFRRDVAAVMALTI